LKKIIYYVTDHGKGHATRSISIIRELHKKNFEIIIRNSNLIDFFKKSLPSVRVIPRTTDVGPVIQSNGISIDVLKTKDKVAKWIANLDLYAKQEHDVIEKIKPNLIISDISAMPFLAAHKAHITSLAISNFSWSDVLKDFFSKEISILNSAYEKANYAIQLPLGTKMKQFKNKKKVGIVCRKPTLSKDEVRKKIGVKNTELCVFLNLDGYYKFDCKIGKNVKIISTGARIKSGNVVQIKPWIEGQNLVSASDLVISKCGYGITSECLTNATKFQYLSDDKHLEQQSISFELEQRGFKNKIDEKELYNLNINEEFILSKKQPKKEEWDTNSVVNIISEILN